MAAGALAILTHSTGKPSINDFASASPISARAKSMASQGGIGGHHGCHPAAAEAHVVYVHGQVGAMHEMRAGDHAMKCPDSWGPTN